MREASFGRDLGNGHAIVLNLCFLFFFYSLDNTRTGFWMGNSRSVGGFRGGGHWGQFGYGNGSLG